MSEGNADVRKGDLEQVIAMVNGYQRTCLAAAAVELRLFDELAEGERTINDLATGLGVDEGALARFVRALAAIGLITQQADRAALTGRSRLLLAGGLASSLRSWTVLIGGEYLALWSRLADSVRSGGPVFEAVFDCSAWKHREDRPALNKAFNEVTTAEQHQTIRTLLRTYDFAGARCVADVGGGHGNLVAGVLNRYPELEGIVFDLPHVVEGARAALTKAGLEGRCRIVGGSFLESAPAGADVHILKHVLHNWNDESCRRILRNVRAALNGNGRLLILENVISDEEVAAPLAMLDMHMLVVHGGRERTKSAYATLLASAGFRMSRFMTTRQGAPDIIEALPT